MARWTNSATRISSPCLRGEKFNAEEWADLFQKAGARFAGPVAEHHDGFAMWDTKYSPWNAAKMGPKRDVVGELAKAIKKRDMKFVAAFHHAESWLYFPTFDKRYDCGDPRYSGLYGFVHEKDALPSKAFLDLWKGKIIEVIDKYDPDLVWFDNGLELITDSYKQDMLAYYYNHAAARKKEVVVTYKRNTLPPGTGLLDLERGQEADLTYYEWITDSTVDVGRGWGYVKGLGFKTVDNLVVNLVDRVSKNGYLLLNVGPKPDGTIPDEAKKLLLGMGKWLRVNGDAIYGTTPWVIAGEGPTRLTTRGDFNEKNNLHYTGRRHPLHGQGQQPLRDSPGLARRASAHHEPRSPLGIVDRLERALSVGNRLDHDARRRQAASLGNDQARGFPSRRPRRSPASTPLSSESSGGNPFEPILRRRLQE